MFRGLMDNKSTKDIFDKRQEYLDVAKGLGILGVVFTHSPMFISVYEQMSPIIIWVAAFHMPLFFVICGFYISEPKSIDEFFLLLRKRVKGIVIPYFFWAIIYSGLTKKSIEWILLGTNLSLNQAGSNSVLWFLTAYFVSNIFFYCASVLSQMCKYKKLFWTLVILFCLILAKDCKSVWTPYGYPWGFDVAFTGIIFIIIGKGLEKVVNKIKEKKSLTILIASGGLILNTVIAPLNYSEDKQYIMAYASFGQNYYIYIVNAAIASIGIILLCTLVKRSVVIKWIGRNSNGIMILHYFIFEFTIAIANPFVQYNQILAAGVLTISTIVLCVPIILLLQKYIPEII